MESRPVADPALEALAGAARSAARATDLDDAVDRLLPAILDAVGGRLAALILVDPDRTGLQLAATIGFDDPPDGAVLLEALAADAAIAEALAERRIVARSGGPSDHAQGGIAARHGIVAERYLPLVVRHGANDEVVGLLAIGWDGEPGGLPGLEAGLADILALALDRARVASLLSERSEWFERMAHSDPLTGLANRRTFDRILELEIARAGRQASELSVVLIDVDGLAALNEAAGQPAGDDALRAVASVLGESVRLVDTVARFGGDEFAVVAPGAAGITVGRRVIEGTRGLSPVGGRPLSVSAGVARFPTDGTTVEELVNAATRALAEAKAAGLGQVAAATDR